MECLRIGLYEKLWNIDKPGDVNGKVTNSCTTAERIDRILNAFSFFFFHKMWM